MLALALTIAHATPAAAQARWSLHLIKARDARDAFALRTCPPRHTAGRIARSPPHSANWGRVMTMNSLLSRERITAIKDHFAAAEMTDADLIV
jgi:hypothetical protein